MRPFEVRLTGVRALDADPQPRRRWTGDDGIFPARVVYEADKWQIALEAMIR
jgi:hypothetical protein